MKMLLLKDVRKLGFIGDVVDVKNGYARNFLVPYGHATVPTEENIQAIAAAKEEAARARLIKQKEYQALIEKLADVSVTIEAAANPEGNLYGSVSARDIAKALKEQGFEIDAECVALPQPIRTLDNRMVTLEFTDDLTTEIKVWVVREGETGHGESSEIESASESAGDEPVAEAAEVADE
ncbi:MAG: 50S ribosomal protein L9 [Phycisphaerae bacterium]